MNWTGMIIMTQFRIRHDHHDTILLLFRPNPHFVFPALCSSHGRWVTTKHLSPRLRDAELPPRLRDAELHPPVRDSWGRYHRCLRFLRREPDRPCGRLYDHSREHPTVTSPASFHSEHPTARGMQKDRTLCASTRSPASDESGLLYVVTPTSRT